VSLSTLHFQPHLRRWPTEHVLSIKHAQTRPGTKSRVPCTCRQSAEYKYINTRPLCVEGPGGCPTPPQADPLLATHLLGVPVFTGKSRSRSAPLLLRYALPLIGCAIILPHSNLRWVVSKWSLRRVRAAVKPSDEPPRKGETRKVQPTYI
jgi:hypothetical protein